MTALQKEIVRSVYAQVFYADDEINVIAADGRLTQERTAKLLDHCNAAAAEARRLHYSVLSPAPKLSP